MALTDKITFLQRLNFDDVYSAFLGLDRRQQIMTGVGLGLMLIIALSLPASCVSSKLSEKQQEYEKHVKRASKFYGYLHEIGKLQKSFDEVQDVFSRMGDDSLSTVVYKLAEEMGVQKSKVELKSVTLPAGEAFQEVGKEVRMTNIPFDELMKFLDRLTKYESLPLAIKKLTIKADQNKRQIMHDVSFTVSTIRPNK